MKNTDSRLMTSVQFNTKITRKHGLNSYNYYTGVLLYLHVVLPCPLQPLPGGGELSLQVAPLSLGLLQPLLHREVLLAVALQLLQQGLRVVNLLTHNNSWRQQFFYQRLSFFILVILVQCTRHNGPQSINHPQRTPCFCFLYEFYCSNYKDDKSSTLCH